MPPAATGDRATPTATSAGALAELVRHRDLLAQFTVRAVHARHRGSILGGVWMVLGPLLLLALYTFVFGAIFGGTFGAAPWETPVDHALGIFLGLTLHHLVAETLATSPTAILGQPNLVKKVVFPLAILPVAQLGASLVHAGVSLALCLLGIAFLGHGLPATVLWLPLIIAPLALYALGAAWLLAALGVFLRDLAHAVQFVSLALMFASAVFYPVALIPPAAWTFLRFNPLLRLVDEARNVALWGVPPDALVVAALWAGGLVSAWAGLAVFRRLRPAFADVL